jgi:aspartate racemase
VYSTVGVLGGMGPAATIDFLQRLAEFTPASKDQDHVPVVLYSDPSTPDRTAALRGQGPSPLPAMLTGIRFLDSAAVSCIAIPCNTAHAWYHELAAASATDILNIVTVTIQRLQQGFPKGTAVGVLSTDGTRRSELYSRPLRENGFAPRVPDGALMSDLVEPGISAVKAGNISLGRSLLREAARQLAEGGAEALVVACTDISVVIREGETIHSACIIDANSSLARAAIDRAAQQTD